MERRCSIDVMRPWILVLVVAGCGRVGFDPRVGVAGDGPPAVDSAAGGGGGDAATGPDGSAADSTSCDDVHAGALFCDGFEGAPVWAGQRMQGATATISNDKVYRGSSALKVVLAGGAQSAGSFYATNPLGGITSGKLYIRGYFYIPSGTPATHLLLLWAAGTGTPPADGVGYAVDNELAYGENNIKPVGFSAGVAVPRDKWTCLEMEIDIGSTGNLSWTVDGAFGGGVGGNDVPTGGYQRFEVGVVDAPSTQAPIDVYVDEVVADTAPIGCD